MVNIHPGGNGGDGHEHTLETRLKMSIQKRGTGKGADNPWFGKHPSIEVRKRFSEVAKQRHKNGTGNKLPIMKGVDNPSCKKKNTYITNR